MPNMITAPQNKELNGALLQDLHHHTLAMMGEENGMDANSLRQRLESADRALAFISRCPAFDIAEYQECMSGWNDISSEGEMVRLGKRLHEVNQRVAEDMGIDSRTGETFVTAEASEAKRTKGKVVTVKTLWPNGLLSFEACSEERAARYLKTAKSVNAVREVICYSEVK